MHPVDCDQAGRAMTSPPSVVDERSVTALWSVATKGAPGSTWGVSGGGGLCLFHRELGSLCKCWMGDKEVVAAGMAGICSVLLQRFLKRNSRRTSAASSQSSIWPSDKYLINSWNVSFALHNLISSWGEAFCRYTGSGVDVGDKTNCALLSPVEVKSSFHSCACLSAP